MLSLAKLCSFKTYNAVMIERRTNKPSSKARRSYLVLMIFFKMMSGLSSKPPVSVYFEILLTISVLFLLFLDLISADLTV